MRSYEETITWLRFSLDLRQAPPSFWLLLGECVAGIRHLNSIPLPAVAARELEHDLLASASHARLALDGITLPKDRIATHLIKRPKRSVGSLAGQPELDALLGTGQQIIADTAGTDQALTPDHLKGWHVALTSGTSSDEGRPGSWRSTSSGNKALDGVPPDVIGVFTEELCEWLNGAQLAPPSPQELEAYGLIHCLIAELYLWWIRPFPTAHASLTGLVGQYLLRRSGLGSTAGHLASVHFHAHGREFQRSMAQAAEGTADPIPFLAFGLSGIAEGLRDLHIRVRELQRQGQWRAQLLDLFSDAEDEPTRRQRRLLLDLGDQQQPVPLNQLSSLSTASARLYAGVSDKTLRRDVDALVTFGVLHRSEEGLWVDRNNMLAFKD